ncbi:hypothetical protein Sipo8835_20040 [Streptomyces ipomoeae]|uniref:Uncharacterized protein n=1 Tax=Streptomyces ipomoeae TaxID=103232 RepID=A0AAE8W0Z1_9ACTN|nr:hypothetical protein [Streptomyces ipomoeae]TQE24103.1 hypothetical protein Sipo7851_36520 [Streptomyces ipomoeae]TQE32574.1 hypothetical protein Sipo8835_20040 [Streptomyces ipomoeae]
MTPAAVPPGAGVALRVLRGAAGRRVAQVMLLVGGLFVLGLLSGERASAADGVPTSPPSVGTTLTSTATGLVPSAGATAEETGRSVRKAGRHTGADEDLIDRTLSPVGRAVVPVGRAVRAVSPVGHAVVPVRERVVEPVTKPVVQPVTKPVVQPVAEQVVEPVSEHVVRPVDQGLVEPVADDVVRPITEDLVQPVAEGLVQPVADQVVRPIGEVVESVAEGLGEVSSEFPPVTEVPELPELPELPGLPELPELPGLPVLPVLPGKTLPADVAPQVPGGAGAERAGAVEVVGGERDAGPDVVVQGPQAWGGGVVAVAAGHRDAGVGDARTARLPGPQSPDDLPTGALGGHSAADNGGPRHAEPLAVTSLHRAPLSLVPGVSAADVADGARDRHRDIPEFPG